MIELPLALSVVTSRLPGLVCAVAVVSMNSDASRPEAVINEVEIAYFTQEENIEELLVNFIVGKGIGAYSVTGGIQ